MMGEKIKDLSSFRIGHEDFVIEYNKGWSPGEADIHIQSENFRFCVGDEDFMKIVSVFSNAKRKLESIKNNN